MQLNLFDAQVKMFPLARQAALVREVAAVLLSMDDDASDIYWTETCQRLGLGLRDRGMTRSAAEVELTRFAQAVTVEMHRQAGQANFA